MRKYKIGTLALAMMLSMGIVSCKTGKEQINSNMEDQLLPVQITEAPREALIGRPSIASSPVVYVYKTKKDYSHQVPVLMDATRVRIVSYPHPGDLYQGGTLSLPTALDQGYWLDNRGIGPYVAFLTYTYEEYSRLAEAPSMEELLLHILDKEPLTEIHECGRRADYTDLVLELNKKIADGFLRK